MTEKNDQQEILGNVLGVTREQLAKAMSLSAELEALLIVERRKNAELQHQVRTLEAKSSDK
jgi:BMFP domain-containing protein YqiC